MRDRWLRLLLRSSRPRYRTAERSGVLVLDAGLLPGYPACTDVGAAVQPIAKDTEPLYPPES